MVEDTTETMTVTDGTVTEECEVVERQSHYSHELAYVSGEEIEGWVEQ
jgi:hypothetical protein